jgi:hypothetical protein
VLTWFQVVEYVLTLNLERRACALLGCVPVVPGRWAPGAEPRSMRWAGFSATTLAEDTDVTLALGRRGVIADDLNNQGRKVTAEGMIETVAGTGVPGRTGDGGAAVTATLRFPQGVALAADGDLYIADTGNDRVRRVTGDGSISTVV